MSEQNNKTAKSNGFTHILSAFRLILSATLVTLLLSVATNKAIAVVVGLEGIALMGIYRNFAALIARPLTLGFDTILVQQMSVATSKQRIDDIIGATLILVMFQGFVILLLILYFAELLSQWLFDPSVQISQVINIRIVMAMAFANLCLQMITALLNGKANLKQSSLVTFITALSSLLVIYPLLQLGNIGLAFNVGSGSVFGVVCGILFTWKLYEPSFSFSNFNRWWHVLRQSLSPSVFLITHPIVMMISLLLVQLVINSYYGLQALGAYTSATMIIDTGVMVLMSSVKTYYLPSLGDLQDSRHKQLFLSKVLSILLLAAMGAGGALVVCSKYLTWLLFSQQFVFAADLVAIFSLSLVGQVFIWTYSTFFLHKANYWLFFLMDVVWAGTLVTSTILCAKLHLPLTYIGWGYVLSYTFSGLLYITVSRRIYGSGMLSRRNAGLGILAVFLVGLGYALHIANSQIISLIFFFASSAGLYYLLRRLVSDKLIPNAI